MRKFCFLIGFILVGSVAMSEVENCSTSEKDDLVTRTVELENNNYEYYKDYLNTFENNEITYEGSVATFNGEKAISSESLEGIDKISNQNEAFNDCNIKYSISFDAANDLLILSAEMVNEYGEACIDKLTGNTFINSSNDIDAYFDCDGETITLSQMRDAEMIQNCGFIANLIKSVVKVVAVTTAATIAAVGMVVNSAKAGSGVIVAAATGVGLVCGAAIGSTVQSVKMDINYANNRKRPLHEDINSKGYITDQSLYSDWSFVFSDLKFAGCEVISVYNLMVSLGRTKNLFDIIYDFELLNIDIDAGFGFLGSNPQQIVRYFITRLVDYTIYSDFNSLKLAAKKMKTCKIVFSEWTSADQCGFHHIHTFFIEKINGVYTSYNGRIDTGNTLLEKAIDYQFCYAYIING